MSGIPLYEIGDSVVMRSCKRKFRDAVNDRMGIEPEANG
jgi:hypothetical protein